MLIFRILLISFAFVSGEKPCKKWKNVDFCDCADGNKYNAPGTRQNCKKQDIPILFCSCKDGSKWKNDDHR